MENWVCLDPRDLNQAIKRQHYQLPTAEDILSQMAGAKYFSKLDASSGYWQLKLDDESSKLLAFHTPFGRYKFKRLPFGVNCASEIFQAEVPEILEGLEGCANAQDDIVVWGDTKDNHDRRLKNVLSRIRFSGYKLNRSKCIFGSNQITYLGQLLTSEGVKADPRKVSAILDMPAPENKSAANCYIRHLSRKNRAGQNGTNRNRQIFALHELRKRDKHKLTLTFILSYGHRISNLVSY